LQLELYLKLLFLAFHAPVLMALPLCSAAEREAPQMAAEAEGEAPQMAAEAERETPQMAAEAEREAPQMVAEGEAPQMVVAGEVVVELEVLSYQLPIKIH
jgi:regulator of protease activity HflC (stomatin/prohibitin superfamily)